MKTVKLLNENGNQMPSVRDELKAQVVKHSLPNFSQAPNGKLYLHIADEENGLPIYALLSLTITTDETQLIKTKSHKKAVNVKPTIPNLFE